MELQDLENFSEEELLRLLEDPWTIKMMNLGQCFNGLQDFFWPLWKKLIGFSVLQLLVYHTCQFQYITERRAHIIVTALGVYLLLLQSNSTVNFVIPLINWAVFYISDQFMLGRNDRGKVCILISILSLIFWQVNLSAVAFSQIRGVIMIMCMKLISLTFDDLNPSMFENLAFVFNPSTVIFGPFIRLDQFRENFIRPNTTVKSLILVPIYSLIAFFFVFYSTCLTDFIPTDPQILGDFATAQSFRFSHFFVCYLSLTTALLGGFSFNFQVAGALQVEWPRSMGQVVVHWNYPMHQFLHQYVFRRVLSSGYALAMLASFAMSSILHGLNFQLSAVLTSLAFYAYVESIFRRKLSNFLGVCAMDRKCPEKCPHTHKENSFQALAINLIFTFLNIYHLIYLGMPFDGTLQETGYSFSHTISHWSRWNFSSHLIASFMLFLGLL
ncbi:unnamed protein product [Bursaphelenchus xylophilus]|uniref:Protein-serine O-palmitoleoyltransferase porcupine n=1 Tax=Bursaphelenchus xylophilus TaxID=6326 RepID=A0A7I8XCK0_BURXY|nr:unnamed protein product [Bursaphelenchus xylophilus]CAG9131491.1 unnamed protein product [Bursaphelenchus xylophilus]